MSTDPTIYTQGHKHTYTHNTYIITYPTAILTTQTIIIHP